MILSHESKESEKVIFLLSFPSTSEIIIEAIYNELGSNLVICYTAKASELAYKYKFPINENTIATHSERDKKIPHPSGKIDIDYLPFEPTWNASKIHSEIRKKTNWYYNEIIKNNGKLDLI